LIRTKQDIILDYINQFRQFGPEVIEYCFSSGMCWQFSTLLAIRFRPNSRKVYDPIVNHFATEIDGRIYDIRGDITDLPYQWEYWDTYRLQDPKHTKRIVRDCVRKLPSDVATCEFCENVYEDDWCNFYCSLTKEPVDPNHICEKGVREK
jgi:hypothetical protein